MKLCLPPNAATDKTENYSPVGLNLHLWSTGSQNNPPVFSRVCALHECFGRCYKRASFDWFHILPGHCSMQARVCWRAFLVLVVLAAAAEGQSSHIEKAAQLLSNGDMVQAEAEARKSLENPSTRPLGLAMLGTIRLQQGKNEESTKFWFKPSP